MSRKYRVASRQLLRQAREELERGDARQASEKGWGAAAQMVKAIAERRGWEHRGHRYIHCAARRLRSETGDKEMMQLFQVANSLHINFYEDDMEAQVVDEALDDVDRLLEKLGPLFGDD